MRVKFDYTFIFDPSETWSSVNELNKFLAVALAQVGLQAERIDNTEKGEEILLVSKKYEPAKEKVAQKPLSDQKANLYKKV